MRRNVSPDGYAAMTPQQVEKWRAEQEAPYLAANGHRMQQYPRYADDRPVYSSAWTECTDDCPACAAGDPLPDY